MLSFTGDLQSSNDYVVHVASWGLDLNHVQIFRYCNNRDRDYLPMEKNVNENLLYICTKYNIFVRISNWQNGFK